MSTALLFLSAALAADNPATWPQWRGPGRDGAVFTVTGWPGSLTGDALTVIWKIEKLGPSYSGPLILTDRVITTETVDAKREVVTAYDRATAKRLWQSAWDGSMSVPFFAAKNGSWIRATPAADETSVYVAGIRDVLVALNVKDGSEKWRVDFVKDTKAPPPDFGFVCSPLVDETGVYVQAGAAFHKVDKSNGKIIWTALKDGGGMMGSAFSSPTFATVAGKDQVVVQTRNELAGVDRTSGAVLWRRMVPSFRGMNILSPVVFGEDGVFTSTYGGTTQLFKVKSAGGSYETENGWSFKYEGNMTTPVVVNGHAYLLGKDRRAICVDLATGKETWRSEQRFGEYWSLVASGDKILALDNRGILLLLRANPKEPEILSERKVADAETWAHLAVCGNEIYIRDLNGLTAWKWAGK
jgi:outer membrane protein assembly factor BamB